MSLTVKPDYLSKLFSHVEELTLRPNNHKNSAIDIPEAMAGLELKGSGGLGIKSASDNKQSLSACTVFRAVANPIC